MLYWLFVAPLAAWFVYLLGLLCFTVLSRPLADDDPCCTVFGIHVPAWVYDLPTQEWRAIYAHEQGHLMFLHPHKSLLRACVFSFWTQRERWMMECQVDDYAARLGHAKGLSAALLRFDRAFAPNVLRAARLVKGTFMITIPVEDWQWLQQVHGVDTTDAAVILLQGTEDCPVSVCVYDVHRYDVPPLRRYKQNAQGVLELMQ